MNGKREIKRKKNPIENRSFRFYDNDVKWFKRIAGKDKGAAAKTFKRMRKAYSIMSREPIQKASQAAGKASQTRPTTKRGVRAGGAE